MEEISTLYLFGIGGTGERVLRSTVMLVAGGMPMNCKCIQPVFMDSDSGSKALERACNLIKAYRKTKELIDSDAEYFTRSDIQANMFKTEIKEPIVLNISGTQIRDIKLFADAANMGEDEKAEFESLYSRSSQDMNLSWGFVGNPSIGAVILNQMLESDKFKNLQITNKDGVFIATSIFGGTGAAGYPLLVNYLRDKMKGNFGGIKIGALSVFPYFNLNDDENLKNQNKELKGYDVQPTDFSTKTKAALNYYATHVKALSSIYFLGTNSLAYRSLFPKCLGGQQQDNPACLIELWGAKAASHFTFNASGLTNEMDTTDNFKTVYHEYFVDKKPDVGTFYDLSNVDPDIHFREVFVRLQLLKYIWCDCATGWIGTKGNQWATSIKLTQGVYDNLMGKYLKEFLGYFAEWCQELKSDCHKFRFRFFDDSQADSDEQTYITQRFTPSIAHKTSKMFSGTKIIDPDILGLMQKSCNKNIGDGFKDDKMRQQFAFFTSLYAIEHIINDSDSSRKINLNFN